MNIKSLDNNIVLAFSRNIADSLGVDRIKDKAEIIYDDLNPNPVVTRLPDHASIMIPEAQVAVSAFYDTVVITDNTIGAFNKKNTTNLMKLARSVRDIVGGDLVAYGYNFKIEAEGDDTFEAMAAKIKGSFFSDSISESLPSSSTFLYALPILVFTNNRAKTTIKFLSNIKKDGSEELDKILIASNFHFESTRLPALSSLKDDYMKRELLTRNYAKKILR